MYVHLDVWERLGFDIGGRAPSSFAFSWACVPSLPVWSIGSIPGGGIGRWNSQVIHGRPGSLTQTSAQAINIYIYMKNTYRYTYIYIHIYIHIYIYICVCVSLLPHRLCLNSQELMYNLRIWQQKHTNNTEHLNFRTCLGLWLFKSISPPKYWSPDLELQAYGFHFQSCPTLDNVRFLNFNGEAVFSFGVVAVG